MDAKTAKLLFFDYLQKKGKATNTELIELLNGDIALFGKIREELILDDIAEDKKGVGLVYLMKESENIILKDKEIVLKAEPAIPNSTFENEQRIFISYGRQDAMEFAHKLAGDLEKKAKRQVWLDMKSIETGGLFEVKIEEGIRSSSIVLAIMTPHSMREESICRDEIVFALNEGKPVVPIQTGSDVKPPLLLARRNWIDFSTDYELGFSSLLRFLNGDQYALRQPRLPSITGVAPYDFGPEIARYTRGFTGRDWLKKEVSDWLFDTKNRVFIIIGEPGIGKSAIAAWLSEQFRDQVVGIHFCTHRNTRTLNVFEFVANLVSQLHSQLPEYAKSVETRNPEVRRPTASDAFRELIIEPSRSIVKPDRTYFFIIDSLDEASLQEGENIIDILSEQAGDLPIWLKFFATTRPEEKVVGKIRILNTCEISANRSENLTDVRMYIENKLKTLDEELKIGERISSVTSNIENLARGNFLYATLVIDALENKTFSIDEIGELMPGLSSYYEKAFKRMFPGFNEFLDDYAVIFKVLSVSLGPVPSDLLLKISGISSEILNQRLRKIKSFLRVYNKEGNTSYALFHKSLADWLTDPDSSGNYWCDPYSGYTILTDQLYTNWKNSEYALQYLPKYLNINKEPEKLANLLTDLFFINEKVKAGFIYEMQDDFIQALKDIPDAGTKNILTDFFDAFRWEVHNLKKYPRITFQTLYNHLQWKDKNVIAVIEPAYKKYLGSGEMLLRQYRVPVIEKTNLIMSLLGHLNSVNACSWSPDGKRIITAGSDAVLKIWDVEIGKEILTFHGHTGVV